MSLACMEGLKHNRLTSSMGIFDKVLSKCPRSCLPVVISLVHWEA